MHGQLLGLQLRLLQMLKSILPTLYQELFPDSLLDFEITEKKATCDKCALAAGRSPDHRSYEEHLKCCTFHPFQPNYSIGQVLLSTRTPKEIKERIQTKIKNREYVFPIGITAPLPHQFDFAKRKKNEFGNREDWLCPYFDRKKKNCGIWSARNSTCISFHCLSSYGTQGFDFWGELSDYISYVEMALLEEALLQFKFTPIEISEQIRFLNPEKENRSFQKQEFLSEDFYKSIWKNYFGKEEDFYKECYKKIKSFSKKDFKRILGKQGLEIEKKVMTAKKAVLL